MNLSNSILLKYRLSVNYIVHSQLNEAKLTED